MNELYGSEVQQANGQILEGSFDMYDDSVVSLNQKKHNLPEICIEIDMQRLQFRHSRNGPKIFEICGKNSIYS